MIYNEIWSHVKDLDSNAYHIDLIFIIIYDFIF